MKQDKIYLNFDNGTVGDRAQWRRRINIADPPNEIRLSCCCILIHMLSFCYILIQADCNFRNWEFVMLAIQISNICFSQSQKTNPNLKKKKEIETKMYLVVGSTYAILFSYWKYTFKEVGCEKKRMKVHILVPCF